MANDLFNSFMTGPDEKGRFGQFGGRFVSETLMPLILELEDQYEKAKIDPEFWNEMDDLWKHYVLEFVFCAKCGLIDDEQ